MYPGVIIEFDDQSNIPQLPIQEVRNMPLFGAIFTSDKGPEKWTRISGKDFFESYGKSISFARHGQPLLQAAVTINAGGELLCKRLVADDATLANIGIVVSLVKTTVQATDTAGNKLFYEEDGVTTTTTDTGTPVMVDNGCEIKYTTKSVTTAKSVEEAALAIEAELAEGEYLLYVLGDNGRGSSKKRVKITPDYKLSKTQNYPTYVLTVIEGAIEEESMTFSLNPNAIINGKNVSLSSMIRTYSKQLTCVACEGEYGVDGYLTALAAIMDTIAPKEDGTAYTVDEMFLIDALFGCTMKGKKISGVTLDADKATPTTGCVDIRNNTGLALVGGSNGKLGDYPFKDDNTYDPATGAVKEEGTVRAEWIKQAEDALDGTFDKVIFNVDQYKVDAWVDANYPDPVKRSIETLAAFREDFMYFRDMCLGNTDIDIIMNKNINETKTKFAGSYCQSYDVLDPYTKKQITVTIGYTLARLLVSHCNNGCILPTAGMKHGMIIDDAIYGTLSFSPVICPDYNQKEELDEARINYASYIDNQLVVETLYTSQEAHTQWSYINNVMGIQEVVKAIRTRCPVIRYTFIDGEDLELYKADVEEIIAPYRSNFKSLELEFANDTTYAANKIFYAVLKVVYNDFVQTEWFKVTALSAVEVTA